MEDEGLPVSARASRKRGSLLAPAQGLSEEAANPNTEEIVNRWEDKMREKKKKQSLATTTSQIHGRTKLSRKDVIDRVRTALLEDPEPDKAVASSSNLETGNNFLSPQVSTMSACGSSGTPRTEVSIGGVSRPIRLDTQDMEADKLNALVREVRHTELRAKNNEMSRQEKLSSVVHEVDRLTLERLTFNLQVPDWREHTWLSVNIEKRRHAPHDPLHGVLPEQRRRALLELEQATARGLDEEVIAKRSLGSIPKAQSLAQAGHASLRRGKIASPRTTAANNARMSNIP